ncbi:Protein tyrosine kinase [Teratosphaeria destructans]|uniref:cyclin-dependent kinase n=1 Tax=Teratosphaeria destructans TaxID=418781 RepID=A0A9W7SQ59_9PEZI|nr:Protein tyrosine kinase [Teratosphaeria destructans]
MTALKEGAEYVGESGTKYLAVGALGQQNVFTAVESGNHGNIVVLKAPSQDEVAPWPKFLHELTMHELLKEAPFIRKLLDRIPPNNGAGPIMVLEILETTLWHARTQRPFTKSEIRVVARSILQGLLEVHKQGLAYIDLKMQNVLLNGFDPDTPGDGSDLDIKLGDLGIVLDSPSKGVSQPVSYRAPEVYFKHELSADVDIWAFGLIYSHLLEARTRFEKTGIYDDLETRSGNMLDREAAVKSALANDYDLENQPYYQDAATPYQHRPSGSQWDVLRQRGLEEDEVEFLQWVLQADPTTRPTALQILNSRWLNDDGGSTIKSDIAGANLDGAADARTEVVSRQTSRASGSSEQKRKASSPAADPAPVSKVEKAGEQRTFTPTNGHNGFGTLFNYRKDDHMQGSPIQTHPSMASAVTSPTELGPAGTADEMQLPRSLMDEGTGGEGGGRKSRPTSMRDSITAVADIIAGKNFAKTESKEIERDVEPSKEVEDKVDGGGVNGGTYLSYR